MSIGGFGDYDAWKLATPPEYDWPADVCEDCGGSLLSPPRRWWLGPCRCGDEPEYPHPDDLADWIDETQAERSE